MNVYVVLALGLVFYFVVPFIVIVFGKSKSIGSIIISILSLLFLMALVIGLYSTLTFKNNAVFFNFDFTNLWFNKNINWQLKLPTKFDFIINIILLIPVGVACRYFTQNKKLGIRIIILTIVAFVTGILTELGQYILPVYRSVQLTDTLLNIISVILGGCFASLCFVIKKFIKR